MSEVQPRVRDADDAPACTRAPDYLELKDVTKRYGGTVPAVNGVSLSITKGEFITLLGPSGSGKTSTLMMIAGFEEPTSGEITLGGRSLLGIAPHRRNLGMVFQNYALFPHMSAADNVAFPLRMRGVARDEIARRTDAALASVGLQAFARRHPREMSGGQQQRIALARALVFEPDVLLLDEPLGALDKSLREQMQLELKRLHQRLGITTIFVTHDQGEAMTMSDRIAVFNRGRIEQVGTPLEIYHRPATRFVAGFIGDSNIFDLAIGEGGATAVSEMLGSFRIAPSGLAAGTRVRLMVRPETFTIAANARPGEANLLEIAVEGSVHYGDSLLVLGRAGDIEIRVRLPNVQASGIEPGRTLRVSWQPEHAWLLPPEIEKSPAFD
ncbi:MAG TPA: ABC transporter ATP-binding protein [Burkholderiales bacterium]|nr:ABC transporter ATP-binding protein [Burkholderiales bacterium]